MKRREFLKSSLLIAGVSTLAGKASGIFSSALAHTSGAFPDEGSKFLGFQMESKFKPKKMCGTCRYFKENNEAGINAGECTLPAMKSAVKKNKNSDLVWVKVTSYCNMWQKKA